MTAFRIDDAAAPRPALCVTPRRGLVPALAALVLTSLLMVALPSHVAATLHTGLAAIPPTGQFWDFSDSLLVPFEVGGDLTWVIIRAAKRSSAEGARFPELWNTHHPALIGFASADSSFEDLSVAPADTTLYGYTCSMFEGSVYVLRTQEYHYVKLRVLDSNFGGAVLIEYVYQDDGTRVLVNPTPTKASTWGNVKNRYRRR